MTVEAQVTIARPPFTLDVDLEFAAASVVAILGPNGAGKSTLLRAMAGLVRIDGGRVAGGHVGGGRIAIDGVLVDDGGATFVPAHRRSVGMVFQDYALFPHLSVLDNVAFGPRARGLGRLRSRTDAAAMLDRLGVGDLATRRPGQVSGGQAQRVALARALVTDPDLLLLDEPLAALDAQTREVVRTDLGAQLASFAGTTVLVTHDPLDAMLLADRVLVLEDGQVVQDGTPTELARQPASAYVAALLGVNLLRGRAQGGTLALDSGGLLHISRRDLVGGAFAVIRPEAITVHRLAPEGSARNVWPGTVSALEPLPGRVRVHVDAQPAVIASVTAEAVADLQLARGASIWLSVKAVDVDAYPAHEPMSPHPKRECHASFALEHPN